MRGDELRGWEVEWLNRPLPVKAPLGGPGSPADRHLRLKLALKLIVVFGKSSVDLSRPESEGCWVAVCSGDRLHPGEPVLVGHPTTGKGVWLPSAM